MTTSITPLWTAKQAAAEAERHTKAISVAVDAGALAVADYCRQLRGSLYQHVEASRHGLVREELLAAVPAGDLVDLLLAALVADGEVELYQGVYRLPRGAA